jgi:hypothetical protein
VEKMKKMLVAGIVLFLLLMSFIMPILAQASSQKYEKKVFYLYAKEYPSDGSTDKAGIHDYERMKWFTTPISYSINPSCSGFTFDQVKDAIKSAFEEWDSYTTIELFSDTVTETTASAGTLDGINVISWGSLPPGVVAMTTIWYIQAVPESIVVECDTMLSTSYTWSTTGESGKMDVQNVITHEAGHWIVLDDLYQKGASELTMYGYVGPGETKKRTLGYGDILGLWKAYGE